MYLRNICLISLGSFLIIGCSIEPKLSYADNLSNCLSGNDRYTINQICTSFEEMIVSHYQEPAKYAYASYLKDFAESKIPRPLFIGKRTLSAIKRIRLSDFYKENWVKLSEAKADEEIIPLPPISNDQNINFGITSNPITLNPTGPYITCLKENSQQDLTSNILKVISMEYNVDPRTFAKTLSNNLKIENYEDQVLRIIIAVNFHFDSSLLFLNNLRVD